jgi:O-6-methylguanine DNA methyltransferase
VYLGDDDDALEHELHHDLPDAVRSSDSDLRTWARRIREHLRDTTTPLDLPLDVRATPFQRTVWEQLRAIPSGQTRSYREVAVAIGRPTAARAVARACATNPVSVIVPCHRVVRGDGGLGGYRWGLDRKKALLARERGSV